MTVSGTFLFISAVYLLYTGAAAVISLGIRKRYRRRDDLPDVSVVIPARNEESVLAGLLDSLLAVDYPPEKLQIVISNDQSTDRTRELAESYAERFQCRYEIHDVKDEPDVNLRLKTRALCQGLDHATGEVILMTDADCIVPRLWIRTMASYFTPEVGMVCGTTMPNDSSEARYPLTWFETLDWLFLLGSCSGLAGFGQPRGLIGNNFSVRRSSYLKLGTYRSIEDTDPYDDLSLMNAVSRGGDTVAYPADRGLMLTTKPIDSLYELARQRRRWLLGIRETGWSGKLVIGFAFLTHLSIILLAIAAGWWAVLPYSLLMLGNAFVILPMLVRFGKLRLAGGLLFYPVFVLSYAAMILWVMVRPGKYIWKGRALY